MRLLTTTISRTAILFFCFLSSASAQKISTEKGLTTIEFTTVQGTVKVYLPEDIRPGDRVTGTIATEPAGNTDKEKRRSRELLDKYRIGLESDTFLTQVSPGQFICTVKGPESILTFSGNGKAISRTKIPVQKTITQRTNFSIPDHILAASPLRVNGPFDGNAENTRCLLNGNALQILAESPRQCILQIPETSSGKASFSITESGRQASKQLSVVQLDIIPGRLLLTKGESTHLDVSVSGLQGLSAPASLTIINTSTNTVELIGGEAQKITIQPNSVDQNGVFARRFDLKSVRSGSFSVQINLDLPEESAAKSDNALLCNCYINDQTCLIPTKICLDLGGSTSPPLGNSVPSENYPPISASPPIVYLHAAGNLNTQTNQVMLQLTELTDNVSAVIFSVKPFSGNDWRHAGIATKLDNIWTTTWTPSLGYDGEHIIRARVAGKNNTKAEYYTRTYIQLTPSTITPQSGERLILTVSDEQMNSANQNVQQLADKLRSIQERLARLRRKYEELIGQKDQNETMAEELAAIDKTLEQIPGLYQDSLKKLIDSVAKLKGLLPPEPDPAELQKAADDAAQRAKDCKDRLNKLKQEREDTQKELDALNNQIESLLAQLDGLHISNNWAGGHGYHKDGSFWYGYVGDEQSNTDIQGESNKISNQLKGLKNPQNLAKKRLKALDAEIADAEAECDKLEKEKEKAAEAAKNGNALAAAETKIDELLRQIQALLDALKKWCEAHPSICHFNPELSGTPRTAAELGDYLSALDDIIKQKQAKESELEKNAADKSSEAQGVGSDIKAAEAESKAAAEELSKAQAAAEKLRGEREKQLEEERAKSRNGQEEENTKSKTPRSAPTLPQPIEATDKQIKFQALSMLRGLYREYWIEDGPCDCTTKAIALANNSNTAASDVLGGLAIGIVFAPIEALPGLSFAAKLGIGAAKAIGSALYGGESFSDELAKNLFDVIGGEIFPQLMDSETAGNAANKFAGKGLEEVMKAEGIRSAQWEGETVLRECGKIKGKTTMLFNPNTGWVTLLIKIENCPLIVIKYKVNKDGVPVSKPIVTKVQ